MNGRRRALLAAFGAASLAPFAARATTAVPFAQGVLWRLSRDRLPDSFVFGTLHVADARVVAMALEIDKPLAASRALALERIVDDLTGPRVQGVEQLAEGARLEPLIGADAYARACTLLLAQGVPEAAAARMKPWAAMLRIARQPPHDPEASLDQRIVAQARARKLRAVQLEWLKEQAAAFDAVPRESQVAVLLHILDYPELLHEERAAVVDAWLRGDLEALWRFPERASSRRPGMGPHYLQFARHVVQNRTLLMHHRLVVPLRSGRVFVAVGAEHLPGGKGLLALAQRDGYTLTRLL
jgi:uncharacterized protein YbaP (TraB family)